VSRNFASSIVITGGEPTARDLVHWLSMMAPGLVTVDDGGVSTLAAQHIRGVPADVASLPLDLIREARVDRMARLRPMHDRLMATTVMAVDNPQDVVPAFLGWSAIEFEPTRPRDGDRPGSGIVHRCERQPRNLAEPVACRFPSYVLALAHIDHDEKERRSPVWFDINAMGNFKCRYSPIVYLRCLAWLAGDVKMGKAWRRKTTTYGIELTIPFGDLGVALGAPHVHMRTHWDAYVLKPAIRDLDAAGIDLHPVWHRATGYDRVYTGLTLKISRATKDKAVRRAPEKPKIHLPF